MKDFHHLPNRKRLWSALAAAAVLFPAAVSTGSTFADFWSTWGDGKAEVDGYTLTQTRYGQPREGKAVLIFVTEDHSAKEGVKIEGDTSKISAHDKYPVLKLNFIRRFQTGIYDYHIMTSVFCRLDRDLEPSKICTSIQEWCGQVYHQLVMDGRRATETLHSYFGGEGDQTHTYRIRNNPIFEDTLPIIVRELKGPWLTSGQNVERPCGPSLMALRLLHKPFSWKTVKISKSDTLTQMGSVLGKIAVTKWTVETPYLGTYTYWVERGWPHRIIQWSSTEGDSGVLTGSKRLPYWKLHNDGDEKYLRELGWMTPTP